MHLNDIQKLVHQTAVDLGWYVDPITKEPIVHNVGERIALMHSELSEALEEWRKPKVPIDHIYYSNNTNGAKPEGLGVELADCMIRILDFAESNNINLEELIMLKNEYNKTRGFRHGGLKA